MQSLKPSFLLHIDDTVTITLHAARTISMKPSELCWLDSPPDPACLTLTLILTLTLTTLQKDYSPASPHSPGPSSHAALSVSPRSLSFSLSLRGHTKQAQHTGPHPPHSSQLSHLTLLFSTFFLATGGSCI